MNSTLSDPLFIALKGSVAAALALAMVQLLGIPDTLSATFVAVVCISPTVFSGLRQGLEQVTASAIGGGITYALSFVLPSAVVLLIALAVTIWICFRAGFPRAYPVAAFTSLYVLLLPGSAADTLKYRILSVAVGVASAIAVNVIVSALGYRRVFARRLRIARAQLSDEYAQLARALASDGPAEVDPDQLFESNFTLLRTLVEEVSDAKRDSRMRGGRALERMTSAVRAAELLLRVAHYGRDLALIAAERGTPPTVAASVASVSAAIRERQPVATPSPNDADDSRPLQEAIHAWNEACALELAFIRAATERQGERSATGA